MDLSVCSNNHTPVVYRRHFVEKMRRQQKILKARCIAIAIIAIVLAVILGFNLANYSLLENKVSELEDDFIEIAIEREQESAEYQNMVYYTDSCEVKIEELSTALAIAEGQNIALLEENEAQKTAIEELQERQYKYDHYAYALYDTEGKRNDITYDQLLLIEQLCADNRVDPDLVLAIIMVESEGDSDATNKVSTARGYGQFLKGTGQWVYESLMNNPKGSYTHDMAFDGDINISMMVSYLKYLYGKFNSTDAVINSYRGIKDSAYKNKLNYYLKKVNKSLSTV